MSKRVLIVYEEVPESTKYFLEDVSDKDWKWMRLCHMNYGNACKQTEEVDQACSRLSDWLVGKKDILKDTKAPIDVPGLVDFIVHTGFLL